MAVHTLAKQTFGDRLRNSWALARKNRIGYLFVLPLVLYYAVFVIYPLIRTFSLSFYRFEFLRPDRVQYVGLGNYLKWAQDPQMLDSAWVAIKFTLWYVPLSTILALVVALVLDRVLNRFVSTAYRAIFYFPVVLPAAIIFIVWQWIYDPSWGVMNHLLIDILGINWPWKGWLSDPNTALASLIFMSVWRLMGVTMMLFLVGLSNISQELVEAARIDGANEWDLLRHITMPLLRPTLLVVLVLRLQTLGMTEEPLIMTQGGPIRSTMTYGLQAYYICFRDKNWDQGYGAAWYIILGILSSILAYLGWKYLRGGDVE
ncbi:MAG: sugar ABC transporter permease [Chloroflexi bacterium]|nr:sugar ABC transporter permease [Chloroflexota bacterium]